MTDNKIINIGDVCTYSFNDTKNKSLSIVEVVKELSDECVVVMFHQVIFDNSGNDLFTYLCKSGKTMNVSRKYLTKIDLIKRQRAEIERLQEENKNHKSVIEAIEDTINPLPFETDFDKAIKTAKSEAIKEFYEKFNSSLADFADYDTLHIYEIKDRLDLVKEMVGDDNA